MAQVLSTRSLREVRSVLKRAITLAQADFAAGRAQRNHDHGKTIYRKQIRPVITDGADIMDRIFPRKGDQDA